MEFRSNWVRGVLVAAVVVAGTAPAIAQMPPGMAAPSPAEIQAMQARFDAWLKQAPPGSGPYSSVRLEDPSLPEHTIYQPKDLAAAGKLPIVAFGNGGCRNTSIEFAGFLPEIASRGYLVIAAGSDKVPFVGAIFEKPKPGPLPSQRVEATVLTDAVDWAVKENARVGSPYFGKLDIRHIAYMGQSCGGMQALGASVEPRTTTTVVLNSGYFVGKAMPIPMAPPHPWSEFHAPIAYFIGGPADIAYKNAEANFSEATNVPMFKADLPVGHTGAYPQPDPRWVKAVVGWLDWQLKGNQDASKMFLGTDCGLCKDPAWSDVASHGLH